MCLRPHWYGELFSTWLVVAMVLWCMWKTKYLSLVTSLIILLLWSMPFLGIWTLLENFELTASFVHRNYELVEQPMRLAGLSQRLVAEGLEFMKNATYSGQPFLIMMSWIHLHVAIRTGKEFEGVSQFGRYGDALTEMDWSVGEMLKGLKELGVDNDTLIYFSSDNGGHLEIVPDGGYNGHLKGRQSNLVWFLVAVVVCTGTNRT